MNKAASIFLGFSCFVWLSYGTFLLFQPGYLAEAAGVVATTETGTLELRAMYGGLQAAIGLLCGLGCLSASWRGHALVSVAFLTAGLGVSRLVGGLVAGEFSTYTIGGLGFEFFSASCAIFLVRTGAFTRA